MEALDTSRMAVYVATVGLIVASLGIVLHAVHVKRTNKRGRWLRGTATMNQKGLAYVKFPSKSFCASDQISVVASSKDGAVSILESDFTGFTAHSETPGLAFQWIAVGSK